MLQLYRSQTVWIFKYVIYGERHSGTNFLEQSISQTFGLPRTEFFGCKHFFGFAKPERIWYERHHLFIGIVRNPYDWFHSMYDLPHHVPLENRINLWSLLNNEWYSIDHNNKEIMHDRNFTTRPNLQRYKNIFEMRSTKLRYLYEEMPLLAQNYVLIRYEDLISSYNATMKIIQNRFDLKKIGNPPIPYKKNICSIDPIIKNHIDANVDWDLESNFGYYRR